MNKHTRFAVAASIGLHLAIAAALMVSEGCQAEERLDLYDATLQDLVEWTAPRLGKSVVIGADIRTAPVSMFASFENTAQLEALLQNTVVSSGFYYSTAGNTIRISAQALPEPSEQRTAVIQLQHLQSDFATQAVRDVLASNSTRQDETSHAYSVTASPTTNAVIITGTERQIEAVQKVITEIDQPRRQVVITAVVAEIADNDYEALGLNVGADALRLEMGGVSVRPSERSETGLALTFSAPHLSAFLQAVKATGRNRILSTPQLMTLNREPASIIVGQNVPFITGQTTSGSTPASDPFQTITRQDVGISLEVTPFITPANAIELQINQSASSVSNDTNAADIITNTRRISTKVQLQNGEGVVLGGLRSTQQDQGTAKVPFLSNVPVIGRAFQHNTHRSAGSNLIVLITARIQTINQAIAIPDPIQPLVLPALSAAGEGFGAAGALANGAASAR